MGWDDRDIAQALELLERIAVAVEKPLTIPPAAPWRCPACPGDHAASEPCEPKADPAFDAYLEKHARRGALIAAFQEELLTVPPISDQCPTCDKVFHRPFTCNSCGVESVPYTPEST